MEGKYITNLQNADVDEIASSDLPMLAPASASASSYSEKIAKWTCPGNHGYPITPNVPTYLQLGM